jgi:formylglycine-generating enzyme required for sulfatase activity
MGGEAALGGAPGLGGGEMVHLPGGSFLMGEDVVASPSSPRHERTLEGFWIDRTEVAAAAYQLCVIAKACTPADPLGQGVNSGVPGWEDYPANYVTLRQAEAYCAWVGKRLPTEAEWEYAAGGLQGYEYPWGDATGSSCHPNFANPTPQYTDYWHGCAIGQFPANENGLVDVGGGVYEYTSSPYCYYDAYTDTGYMTGCKAEDYALRDAAFSSLGKELARVTFRQPTADDFTHYAIGFRCAADASD